MAPLGGLGALGGLAVVALMVAAASAQADEGLVTTRQGVVQGVVAEDYRVFFGIPFAQPPIGDLRWRAPVEPQAWTGVRDGTVRLGDCIQGDPQRTWFAPTSEDCLYLNVWTPRATNESAPPPLPVLVFVHGGGNQNGGTSMPFYNGAGIVQLAQNVVVVTTNYRLNVFGFLGGSALATESADGANGNYAILDQRAAFQWVRDNIAAFGGDPTRVTIFGLFTGVIMESGSSRYSSQLTQAEADANYNAFAAAHGCAGLACLRAVPAFELGAVAGSFRWTMTVDGVELPDRLASLFATGRFQTDVPVLIGNNEDEWPTPASPNMTEAEYQALVLSNYGVTNGTLLLEVYPASDYASPWLAYQQLGTDGSMTCTAIRNARWMSAFTRVHAYYFTYTGGLTARVAPIFGAFHGSELPFVFNLEAIFVVDDDHTVASHFVAYWTNFARTGDPNVGNRAVPLQWPAYQAEAPGNQHLLIQPSVELRADLKQTQCAVWDSFEPFSLESVFGPPAW